jgi:hypothetical protein
MTSMGKKRELRTHWQRVCKLVLAKEDVLTVSRALELALFMDAMLDVSKVPGEMKKRRAYQPRVLDGRIITSLTDDQLGKWKKTI